MTTESPPARPRRSRSSSSRRRKRKPEVAPETVEQVLVEEQVQVSEGERPSSGLVVELEAPPAMEVEPVVPTANPEAGFATRVPPPQPARPFPALRHGIFFDVENTSRAEHVARVLQVLGLDWEARDTELIAVGNWRVIGHETARLLAGRGAQLVHSAPSVGVRDWSDLRIAVAAGCWLAGARPGDQLQIVTDDQAFDAVGDVAASLGVRFQRLSYRALAGVAGEARSEVSLEPRTARRSRRGGRGGRGRRSRYDSPPESSRVPRAASPEAPPAGVPQTAPHDEILTLVHELLLASPGGVSLDGLSNALKARGFRRPPGSPRLITRIHRIKELVVLPGNLIQLANGSSEPDRVVSDGDEAPETVADAEGAPNDAEASAAPEGEKRRRRRRGGRRRRGRGRSGGAAAASEPPAEGDNDAEAGAGGAPSMSIVEPAPEPGLDISFDFDPIR